MRRIFRSPIAPLTSLTPLTVLGSALALLILALPATSLAGHPCSKKRCDHRGKGPGDFVERHAEELGLDAATREAIDAVVADHDERDEALRDATREAYGRLHELLEQDAPDAAAVLAVADEITALKGESRKNRLATVLEIRARLTPEQRARLVELREARRDRHRDRFGACRDDVEALCPDAESARDRMRCFAEQWDSLSEPCRAHLERGPHRRGHGHPGGCENKRP